MQHKDGEGAFDVTPSASRLTESLRDIGYDFVSALGDIVDNSVSALASNVDIEIVFDGPGSYVLVADDGVGMSEGQLNEALRFGTRRAYQQDDLGRYGLGLKTASLSQGRRLTVASRRSPIQRRIALRTLDVDHVTSTDRWEITEPVSSATTERATEWLDNCTGTVVVWENLDRILPVHRQDGGWARRRLDTLAEKAKDHLGMVFHRFLEGDSRISRFLEGTTSGSSLVITINGEKVPPWNPFAPDEPASVQLPEQIFEIGTGSIHGYVALQRFVLPPKDQFSSPSEFERLGGVQRWNRQQGLYIYRSNRLLQAGGWCGIRAADEHTKLARAALDFQTTLDGLFQISVSKMRVALPAEVRIQLEKPIHELCHRADAVYRREAPRRTVSADPEQRQKSRSAPNSSPTVGAVLLAAALELGEHDALVRIMDHLQHSAPESARALGW